MWNYSWLCYHVCSTSLSRTLTCEQEMPIIIMNNYYYLNTRQLFGGLWVFIAITYGRNAKRKLQSLNTFCCYSLNSYRNMQVTCACRGTYTFSSSISGSSEEKKTLEQYVLCSYIQTLIYLNGTRLGEKWACRVTIDIYIAPGFELEYFPITENILCQYMTDHMKTVSRPIT